MYPVIHIFGMHIATYSLMVFLGIIAYVVTYFLLVEKGENLDRTTSNRMLFVSAIGLAVMYLSAYLFDSLYHSIEQGKIVAGGITWLGGVLGSFPVVLLCIHKFVPKAKGSAVDYFSFIMPGIVIAHAFGRLGCFFGGCCYGKVTYGPFGVTFPAGSPAAARLGVLENGRSYPVYPTQLYEALFEFALFFVMIAGRKKFKRNNLIVFLMAYGIFRFLLEFMRGDDRGKFLGMAFSPAQWNCLILLIFAILLILFKKGIIFKKLNEKCVTWREIARKTPAVVLNRRGEPDDAAILRELQKLYEEGIITEREFSDKKAEILKRM